MTIGWTDLPSLNSLRAFASVAEAGSHSRAGAVMNVSHAAVCQQVKALEARLGVALVVREGRRIKLTDDGAVLARHVAKGLGIIREGVQTVTGADAARPMQVTMSPAFAMSWLMPRIADIQHRHPGLTLMLNPTAQVMELTPGGLDLAIRFGGGAWPGTKVTPLLLSDMVVVGAPRLVGKRRPTDPAAIARLPWLQELGTTEVAHWMARRGIAAAPLPRITHMPGTLIMEAVRRGDGVRTDHDHVGKQKRRDLRARPIKRHCDRLVDRAEATTSPAPAGLWISGTRG